MTSLEQVFARGKHYEHLVSEHDPAFSGKLHAIEIVREFIRRNRLIIYGGTAIDFALRLCGDRIYDDAALRCPDLDFYSPTHAAHAYELADEFHAAGFANARAIVGLYTRVMRVDIGDKNFVADISYVPVDVFERLHYLEYDGMRIIHPDFQRIDVHSSASFPYDDPPMEVIFARWHKDFERFNKLAAHYPFTPVDGAPQLTTVRIPLESRHYVFAGIAAYAVLYTHYVAAMSAVAAVPASTVPAAMFRTVGDAYEISIVDALEFMHTDPVQMLSEWGAHDIESFEPYINMLPAMSVGRSGDITLRVLNTHGKLVSINGVPSQTIGVEADGGSANEWNGVDGANAGESVIRVANVQHTLKYLLAMYFRDPSSTLAATYRNLYCGLMSAIDSYEHALATASMPALARASPLFPSVRTYGSENSSLAHKIAIARIEHALTDTPLPVIPRNYNTSRGGPRPTFDPESSWIFRESGRKLAFGKIELKSEQQSQ